MAIPTVGATWESKVRGLMLGLALGDATDTHHADVLKGGAATQLAAWTTEGLLRKSTLYGGHMISQPNTTVLRAYQRWAMLRGVMSSRPDWCPIPLLEGQAQRGWLLDVPSMAATGVGSSPTTVQAVLSGKPVRSEGCQALLRTLPFAATAGPRHGDGFTNAGPEKVGTYAVHLAELTHVDERGSGAIRAGVTLASTCLFDSGTIHDATRAALAHGAPEPALSQLRLAEREGLERPGLVEILRRLAPDRTSTSAVAGGIYVALSHPEVGSITQALDLARAAPHPRSVAATAGALLGAVHGYEALPVNLTSRLELGWTIDQLARDLARASIENQAGSDGRHGPGRPAAALDPWWRIRYPGV